MQSGSGDARGAVTLLSRTQRRLLRHHPRGCCGHGKCSHHSTHSTNSNRRLLGRSLRLLVRPQNANRFEPLPGGAADLTKCHLDQKSPGGELPFLLGPRSENRV